MSYTFPDALRIDELLLRAPADADVDVIAPAFRDPAVGGEAGLPPFDAPQRAGFEREGVKRRLLRHGGGRVDATLFAHVV
jgi:hypothetical protein